MALQRNIASFSVAAMLFLGASAIAQEPPPLPPGLEPAAKETQGEQDEPVLPSGLEKAREPALPPGLDAPRDAEKERKAVVDRTAVPFDLSGFVEARLGSRIVDNNTQKTLSIAETRMQIEYDVYIDHATFRFVGDFLYDEVEDDFSLDLEEGRGFFDLREANAVFRPLDFLDLKAGRQILTWGVGDLVFINDLFPKDFRSFFIGRDDEYLKAPSDAIRVSAFHDFANAEIVYTPRFDPDRFIDGTRLSYFNPALGRIAGRDAVIDALTPDAWFKDDEIAARVYRNIKGYEIAAYGYSGFWKTPEGQTTIGQPFHPRLAVLGASARGPLQGGIVTVEIGRYISRDDADGDNPLIRNGESRFLIGYEKEVATELTASGQYYVEVLSDFSALKRNLPPGTSVPDRVRHVVTLRLTKLMLNQNLTLSAFNFWSPNEEDGHLRFRASYKLSDVWLIEAGGNAFYGANENTFFGQLQDNANLFIGARRSF